MSAVAAPVEENGCELMCEAASAVGGTPCTQVLDVSLPNDGPAHNRSKSAATIAAECSKAELRSCKTVAASTSQTTHRPKRP